MHFEGTVAIAASRQKTWAFLMDPTQVGSCGPGVESIEVVDETHFRACTRATSPSTAGSSMPSAASAVGLVS